MNSAFGLPPYESATVAQTALNDYSSNCIGVIRPDSSEPPRYAVDTFSVTTPSDSTVSISAKTVIVVEGQLATPTTISIAVADNTAITVSFSISSSPDPLDPTIVLILSKCDGGYEEGYQQLNSISPGFYTFPQPIPAGEYTLSCDAFTSPQYPVGYSLTANFQVSCSAPIAVNPVIALYDDNGTTRQLEACPKMLLPPLTESSGSWYSSEAVAVNILASNHVVNSNCLAYILAGSADDFSWFTSWGFSGLTLSGTRAATGVFRAGLSAYISVNGTKGATLSWSWTNAPELGTLIIYDYTGTQIFFNISATSPITSSILPYTGRYILFLGISMLQNTSASGTISSSTSLGVANQIQALWDNGLDCPERLNCS